MARFAVVIPPVAPLMVHPDTLELADEVLCGMVVEVLEDSLPGWYKVRTHYRYEGFARAGDLCLDQETVTRWEGQKKLLVRRGYMDALDAPKVQGGWVASLPRGGILSPLSEPDEKGWLRVMTGDGREGYTKEGFLGPYITDWDPADEEQLRKKLVSDALEYMGTQYRWGGKTPLGIDCSGLCSQVYLNNGIIIYRDAAIKEGFPLHPISREELKPADLIFFPGHVAMYIGEGRFVHSTAKNGSDGVVLNSLEPSDPLFRQDLLETITDCGSIF